MTQWYFSINTGQTSPRDVLQATSAPTADVFVQVLSTNSPTRHAVLLALQAIEQFILSNGLESGSPGTDTPFSVAAPKV